MLLFIGSFVAFFGTGIMPVCKVYIAEQYPTELRGVGTGFGEAVSPRGRRVLPLIIWAFFSLRRRRHGRVFTFMAVCFRHRHHRPVGSGGRETARPASRARPRHPVTHAPRLLPLGGRDADKAGSSMFDTLYSITITHRPQPRCARGVTSAALVRHALEAVRLHDGTLNAMLHVSASALEEARALRRGSGLRVPSGAAPRHPLVIMTISTCAACPPQ